MRTVELSEERPGALAAWERWLEERGWFETGIVRRLDRPGRFAVDEAYLEFFLEHARGHGLRVAR